MAKIVICSWNANGIRYRIAGLIEFLNRRKIGIMMINETKLNEKDKLKIRGYNCIRKDRQNRAGGVAILIRNDIPFQEIKLNSKVTIEYVCIRLESNIHLIAAYNRPLNRIAIRDLNVMLGVANRVLLVGDLNARNKKWRCHINNRNGIILNNYIQHNNVTIMFPNEPTHVPNNGGTPTTIDIAINKQINNYTDIHALHELDSDHNPICFTLQNQNLTDTKHKTLDFKNTDWTKFRTILDTHIKINNKISNQVELDSEVTNLTAVIQKAQQQTVKMITRKNHITKLPDDIIVQIKCKNKTRKKWQHTRLNIYKKLLT